MTQIDVVTVPDFAGPAAKLFEARTLMFLGSWLEFAGASQAWPLHVVCIGEPPESVRSLAKRCQARVQVTEALALPESFLTNKLRGLDVKAATGHILLVDVDTLVLGELSPFLDYTNAIALAPSNQNQVETEMWEEIYQALGVKMPEERVLCLRARYRDKLPPRYSKRNESDEMVPYFNSGVLLTPVDAGLKQPWWDFSERLLALARERGGRWKTVRQNDQVGLAAALAALRERGVAFKELPPICHGNYLLFWAGALSVDNTRIFHGMKLYRLGDRQKPLDVNKELAAYERYLRKGAYPDTLLGWGRRLIGRPGPAETAPIEHEVERLCQCMRMVHEKYVAPAF